VRSFGRTLGSVPSNSRHCHSHKTLFPLIRSMERNHFTLRILFPLICSMQRSHFTLRTMFSLVRFVQRNHSEFHWPSQVCHRSEFHWSSQIRYRSEFDSVWNLRDDRQLLVVVSSFKLRHCRAIFRVWKSNYNTPDKHSGGGATNCDTSDTELCSITILFIYSVIVLLALIWITWNRWWAGGWGQRKKFVHHGRGFVMIRKMKGKSLILDLKDNIQGILEKCLFVAEISVEGSTIQLHRELALLCSTGAEFGRGINLPTEHRSIVPAEDRFWRDDQFRDWVPVGRTDRVPMLVWPNQRNIWTRGDPLREPRRDFPRKYPLVNRPN
jgi:hypothetical protein